MRTLYHLWLSPACRKIRIALTEKKLQFDMKLEKTWERREEFLALNPAGSVPVLVETDGVAVCDVYAITEYLDEKYPEPMLLGVDPIERSETRRLIWWFNEKFQKEVTAK